MSRAHLFRPLQDSAGNLQRGATVRLLRPGTTTLIADPLYTGEDGEDTFSQPVSCPTGFLSVFLPNPRRVRVGVTPFGGGTEVFFDDIDVQRTFQRAQEVPLNPVGGLISSDVQGAIEELQNSKASVDAAARQTAAETPYDPPPGGSLVSTDVQGALTELMTEKYGPDVHPTASSVTFTPAGTIAATDVQAAVQEVASEAAADLASHVAAGDPHPQYLTQARGDARYTQTTVSSVRTIDEEGAPLAQRPVLNFVGRRVTATDDAANNRTNVTVAQPFSKKTANYTLVAATDDVVFFAGANLTATLPDATTCIGVQFTIKNQDATILTVATVAGTIDGDTTRALAQYDALTVVSDGTNYGVV